MARLLAVLLLAAAPAWCGPAPETVQAFTRYVRRAEARIDARFRGADGFLWADTEERRAQLRQTGAAAICESLTGGSGLKVPRGLVHDWVGAVFVPNATARDVLAVVQDYDRHAAVYRPDVIRARLLARKGNEFEIRLRLRRKQIRTVVLDTEHRATYRRLGPGWWTSNSYSTRIAEIAGAGDAERELPEGEDHGYLWRLNSYWSFRERDGGVYVECEAISLTRSVPSAIAFVFRPIIRNLPRGALERTLRATRAAVLENR